MPRFKVAHLREQGQDIVVILVNAEFAFKPADEQSNIISKLQRQSTSAGMKGTVVPVWQSGDRMSFVAPKQWHRFFQSLSFEAIQKNINREIAW